MSSVIAAGGAREGAAEDIDQGRPSCAPPRCARARSPDGSWWVGNRDRGRSPAPRPTASLKRGSPRRASQSSASSYPQAIANMRKRSIAGSVWTTRSGSRHSRIQPRQRLGQAEPAFGPAQQDQPAVGRDQPAREIGGHLLAACGWKIEREEEYLRSWRAWRSRCLGRNALGNEFLPDLNGLRHVRHHIVAPQGIKRARARDDLPTKNLLNSKESGTSSETDQRFVQA